MEQKRGDGDREIGRSLAVTALTDAWSSVRKAVGVSGSNPDEQQTQGQRQGGRAFWSKSGGGTARWGQSTRWPFGSVRIQSLR